MTAGADESHHYRTGLRWAGSTALGYDHYDRNHEVVTDPTTTTLAVSSAPAFNGDPQHIDPEQLLVAAASSCQLLSFLAVAARARLAVVAYTDDAVGTMPTDERPVHVSRIWLRPTITVALPAGEPPTDALRARLARLVDVAHRECYIANSLRTEISIEATFDFVDCSTGTDADTPQTESNLKRQ